MKLITLLINAYRGRKCQHTSSGFIQQTRMIYTCTRTLGHTGEHNSAKRLLGHDGYNSYAMECVNPAHRNELINRMETPVA